MSRFWLVLPLLATLILSSNCNTLFNPGSCKNRGAARSVPGLVPKHVTDICPASPAYPSSPFPTIVYPKFQKPPENGAALAEKDIKFRKRMDEMKRQKQKGLRVNAMAYSIPKELYDKAWKQQDQLTAGERSLLLSRRDLISNALGAPKSLTPEQRHRLLGWPSPDDMRVEIEQATGGALHTPSELLAKARAALERGDFVSVTPDELEILSTSFMGRDKDGQERPRAGGPGSSQAYNLIASMELDLSVQPVSEDRGGGATEQGPAGQSERSVTDPFVKLANEMTELYRERVEGKISQEQYMYSAGSRISDFRYMAKFRYDRPPVFLEPTVKPGVRRGPRWPPLPGVGHRYAIDLFNEDLRAKRKVEGVRCDEDEAALSREWDALPFKERDIYEAMATAMCQAA
ncbi:hypothetical protein NKR23_g1951 [Pleurostoma richardsiae]|uniref:Uncharacterized protein n=1 Tax=Pleurostoma richardsiae TaxID=41990 RepID=A0AA38S9H7_9PEZI|nr:hypothetical protein NKR23_g1951 [Pleurostoma richardsiae]